MNVIKPFFTVAAGSWHKKLAGLYFRAYVEPPLFQYGKKGPRGRFVTQEGPENPFCLARVAFFAPYLVKHQLRE